MYALLEHIRGVGQYHMHYKALTKIFLLNVVLLPGASNKSHSNGCIVMITITTTIKLKVVTITVRLITL